MALRIEYRDVAPGAVEALSKLNAYSDSCSIEPSFRRLIEVLTSQINGCSYCIHVHRRQALKLGESEARLAALADWEASALFSDRERAAFAWVRAVTLVADTGAPERDYEPLKQFFSDEEVVDLTFIVLSMNAWNRLAISFDREVPPGP